ncbi:MAG: hypothetical protein IVW57_13165, partial [Ktedonobacterales bacterium]|nr:hypothetical protein [Ktedonobacterales bacterium]
MSTEKKPLSMPPLVAAKLKAFEQIRADFEESFQYAQEVHGQRRFDSFPVPAVVRYLHALWICDCKDQLLSVPRTIERYEGPRALALLLAWQEGDSAGVIEFLQAKLDMLPFGQITQQMREEALAQRSDPAWVARLAHGRRVLLNRGMNLYQALDAIFVL